MPSPQPNTLKKNPRPRNEAKKKESGRVREFSYTSEGKGRNLPPKKGEPGGESDRIVEPSMKKDVRCINQDQKEGRRGNYAETESKQHMVSTGQFRQGNFPPGRPDEKRLREKQTDTLEGGTISTPGKKLRESKTGGEEEREDRLGKAREFGRLAGDAKGRRAWQPEKDKEKSITVGRKEIHPKETQLSEGGKKFIAREASNSYEWMRRRTAHC